jgi:transcriptional regulator with XRE-family HTH domain
MDIHQIEAARKALQVSQYELCKRADINPSTYTLALRRGSATRRILGKLERAISGNGDGDAAKLVTLEDVRLEMRKIMRGGHLS